jgi:hypothetical protein
MITAIEYIREYRALVAELEGEGLTTSDAQGCAEVELYKAHGVYEMNLVRQNPAEWLRACEIVEGEGK